MTQSAKFQSLKKPTPNQTPECNIELTDQKIEEGFMSKEANRYKKGKIHSKLITHSLNQRNNEQVNRFLTQMKKHEMANDNITPMSKVETAHCTPIDLIEGEYNGKTSQSNMSPMGSKE